MTLTLHGNIKPELWSAIREKVDSDADGAPLIGQVFGGDSPLLKINSFQTETEKSEHKGFEDMLRGVYRGIRNPRSHEQFSDTKAIADAVIIFISYLISGIEKAKQPFTVEEPCVLG